MSVRSNHCLGRDALPSAGSQVCTDRGEQIMDKRYTASTRWTQPYHHITGWRKRQTLDRIIDDLHTQQLDMIDEAVDRSDLSQAKELISWIMNK